MRFWLNFAVFASSLNLVFAQGGGQFVSYLQTANVKNEQLAEEKLGSLIAKLGEKERKSDRQFLRSVFNLTHRQVLKQYDQYATFGELFESGRYDCLTATALYSVVLSKLGYAHSVIETNYHIFLLINSDEGQILMESTDPIGGFEYNQERITNRIEQYKKDAAVVLANQAASGYLLFNEVSMDELKGLLYYNQCVKAFNNQQWMEAIKNLDLASRYYYSERIQEMENLLMNVIASAKLENAKESDEVSTTRFQVAQRYQQP
ncbi:MAG: hypothetical protein KDC99_05275 [Cyclobacteriaceae bacterium]|nr:hypothetical protein [Cyclobacteriaceae bacterium]